MSPLMRMTTDCPTSGWDGFTAPAPSCTSRCVRGDYQLDWRASHRHAGHKQTNAAKESPTPVLQNVFWFMASEKIFIPRPMPSLDGAAEPEAS